MCLMGVDTVPVHLGFEKSTVVKCFLAEPNTQRLFFCLSGSAEDDLFYKANLQVMKCRYLYWVFLMILLSTIIFNFLPAAAEQRYNKRRSERLNRLNSPAKRNDSQCLCLSSAEAAHIDRLCCPCILVFSLCLFTVHASHTGILQGGINAVLVFLAVKTK